MGIRYRQHIERERERDRERERERERSRERDRERERETMGSLVHKWEGEMRSYQPSCSLLFASWSVVTDLSQSTMSNIYRPLKMENIMMLPTTLWSIAILGRVSSGYLLRTTHLLHKLPFLFRFVSCSLFRTFSLSFGLF